MSSMRVPHCRLCKNQVGLTVEVRSSETQNPPDGGFCVYLVATQEAL